LKVSVVDLGFNSVKLVNYNVNQDNSYSAYEQESVKVKLGESLNESGYLGRQSIQRTIDSLKLFRDIIDFQSIKHVLAVATSAVREAGNKDEFLKEVYEETGFRFRVLSGQEEALYSFAGALKSTCIPTALFFDLGGGSLEIVYTENYNIKKLISLPLGSLRLSQTYGRTDGTFAKKNYFRMKTYILNVLPTVKELDMSPDTTIVGVGGTLRAMARYDQQIGCYPLNKIHNYRMDYESINSISASFYKMKSNDIAKIDVIGNNRSETIAAGSCIINMLMQKLRFQKVVVSSQGLREGILSAFLESPKTYYTENINHDRIQNSVTLSCKQEIIQKPANTFIEALVSIGLIKEREHEIIAHAIKQMSEIPLTTNLHNMFYMIIDEDSSHLSHSEQLVLALSIIYTRKAKTANSLFTRYRSILQPQNKKSIEKIAVCISLSEILGRNKSKVKLVSLNATKIVVMIIPGKKNLLPIMLLENMLKNFEIAFGVSIDYYISDHNVKKQQQQINRFLEKPIFRNR
jgi:exopolyphosphatase / guanosine-5'-triphosphate,3'-diphosphate pyrophosphatase